MFLHENVDSKINKIGIIVNLILLLLDVDRKIKFTLIKVKSIMICEIISFIINEFNDNNIIEFFIIIIINSIEIEIIIKGLYLNMYISIGGSINFIKGCWNNWNWFGWIMGMRNWY